MSEKGLNNVIRELRVAKEHLSMAGIYTETQLNDYNVLSTIHDVSLSLRDVIEELNTTYRQTH